MKVTTAVVLWLLCALWLPAQAGAAPGGEPDWRAGQERMTAALEAGDNASAYLHAAWLAWLAPQPYAETGAGFLRQRAHRDRAGRSSRPNLAAVRSAVEAQQLLYTACLDGAIAQQAGRVRREVDELLARAEGSESRANADPVARMALVHLALTLDDALVFEGADSGRRARVPLLRSAASRAAAVAGWVPTAPGPRRALAVIRARLADLDPRPELREIAIAEAERAWALDPGDGRIADLLWTLHLRAGRWAEAREWQARAAALPAL